MKVIGITGPTGAGKTTALNALRDLGGCIIDADAVYHDLTVSSAPMREELTARFGEVYQGNVLDRKKLGSIVFQDPEALADLNAITHKYVDQETGRRIAQARAEGLPLECYTGEREVSDDDGSFVLAGYPRAVVCQGSHPYGDEQYHLPGDVPERVDLDCLLLSVQAILAAILRLDQEGLAALER